MQETRQQITFIGKKTNLITWSTGEIKKNGACVFLSTVFFLSFLAGKFWIVKQPIINSFSRSNKIAISVLKMGAHVLPWTLRILERKGVLLFCTSEYTLLQSFLFDPSLMVRDIRRSIWNKIEINDKLIRAIELRVVVCMKKYKH